jgi:hypothetical protein
MMLIPLLKKDRVRLSVFDLLLSPGVLQRFFFALLRKDRRPSLRQRGRCLLRIVGLNRFPE